MLPKIPHDDRFERNGHSFVYEFGLYRLIPAEHSLFRNEEKLQIKPKALELLVFLIERNNRVVSKAEIIDGVWSDSYVEEANLAVHISALRKVFSADEKPVVKIETLQRIGYRLEIEGDLQVIAAHTNKAQFEPPAETVGSGNRLPDALPTKVPIRAFLIGLAVGIVVMSAVVFLGWRFVYLSLNQDSGSDANKKFHSFKTVHCPEDAVSSNSVPGGCEEAVQLFTLDSNPSGNWSYGYTQKDNISEFTLFRRAEHNNFFFDPKVPSDIWRRPDEWQPSIFRNTSSFTIVHEDGIVVPPHMFEMHPGPKGERSVLRWTAPVKGNFRAQGQFRGLNTNNHESCQTSTDVLVSYNSKDIPFSAVVQGYNNEKPFDVTLDASPGDTIDFSVGYGKNQRYDCDSTGVNVLITTISLAKR